MAGVAADDLATPGCSGPFGQLEVAPGQVGPAGFVFYADGVAALMDGFDQGGADPAHRVEHEVAGLGVGGYRLGGDGPGANVGRGVEYNVGWRNGTSRSLEGLPNADSSNWAYPPCRLGWVRHQVGRVRSCMTFQRGSS